MNEMNEIEGKEEEEVLISGKGMSWEEAVAERVGERFTFLK